MTEQTKFITVHTGIKNVLGSVQADQLADIMHSAEHNTTVAKSVLVHSIDEYDN